MKGPNRFQSNFRVSLVVLIYWASNRFWDPSGIYGASIRPSLARSSSIAWLWLISTRRGSWIWCTVAWTWSASSLRWFCSFAISPECDIRGSARWKGKKGVHYVDPGIPLFATNSVIGIHFTQSSCRRFTINPEVLFHACIHPFCLTVRFWVERCWQPILNPKTTIYLAPTGWHKLGSSIRNNRQWESMIVYHLL